MTAYFTVLYGKLKVVLIWFANKRKHCASLLIMNYKSYTNSLQYLTHCGRNAENRNKSNTNTIVFKQRMQYITIYKLIV